MLWAVAGILTVSSISAQSQQDPNKQIDETIAKMRAEEKSQADELAAAREKRKAEPMSWVNTLDPLPQGGWQFRFVAGDGSATVFSSSHQRSRVGAIVTVWFRYEHAEPIMNAHSFTYMSNVEKTQFDCANARTRLLSATYYAENNLAGKSENVEQDPNTISWRSIAPGSGYEVNIVWACGAIKSVAPK